MSQTRDQKRFTISEVAADWHELMIPQRTMRPSIATASALADNMIRGAASRHTTATVTLQPTTGHWSFPVPRRIEDQVGAVRKKMSLFRTRLYAK